MKPKTLYHRRCTHGRGGESDKTRKEEKKKRKKCRKAWKAGLAPAWPDARPRPGLASRPASLRKAGALG